MDGPTTARRNEQVTRALDVLLIAVVVGVGWAGMIAARTRPELEAAPITAPMAALAAAAAVPLWWRRERPLGMLAAVVGCLVVASAIDERGLFSVQVVLESLALCFAVGAWSERPRLAIGTLLGLMLLLVLGAAGDEQQRPGGGRLLGGVDRPADGRRLRHPDAPAVPGRGRAAPCGGRARP